MLRIKNVGLIMVAIILLLTPTIVFGASGYSSQSIQRATVTFDTQGGNVSQTSKSVILNSTYGDLPVPTKSGYIFDGWYTGKSGSGTRVLSSKLVTDASDHTLYAKWINNISSSGGSDKDNDNDKETDDKPKVPYVSPSKIGNYIEVACTYNDGKVITKSYDVLAGQKYAMIATSSVRNSKPLDYNINSYKLLNLTRAVAADSNFEDIDTSAYNELVAYAMDYKCPDTFYRWLLEEYDSATGDRNLTLVYFFSFYLSGRNYKDTAYDTWSGEHNLKVFDYLKYDSRSGWDKFWGSNEEKVPQVVNIGGSKASQTLELVSERISFVGNLQPRQSAIFVQSTNQASSNNKYLTISYYGDGNHNQWGDESTVPIMYADNGDVMSFVEDMKFPGVNLTFASAIRDDIIGGKNTAISSNICVKDSVESISGSETVVSNPRIDIQLLQKNEDSCDVGYTKYEFSHSTNGGQGNSADIMDICSSIPATRIVLVRIIIYLQIIIPILLIVYTGIDIGRIVLAGNIEEELPKKKKAIIIRFIVAIAFFFIPFIIRVIFDQAYTDPKTGVGGIDCLFEQAAQETAGMKGGSK